MVQHVNFYENLHEANMRLKQTVVCYEGEAYYVVGISDHSDGRFRIYIDKMDGRGIPRDKYGDIPHPDDFHINGFAAAMDAWMNRTSDHGVVRKYMSAAGFNKFRPFPLGNVNEDGEVIYVERTPTRNTIQGLREQSIVATAVTCSPKPLVKNRYSLSMGVNDGYGDRRVHIYNSKGFVDMVAGRYPTYRQVVEALRNPEIGNTGCAFDRDFSVLRGPVNTLCLCYQTEGVGFIEGDDLVLSRNYEHLLEQIQELGVFRFLTIK